MTEALESVCSEVVNVLRTVDGIDQVPLNPTSVQSYTTFGLVYPNSGTTEATPTGTRRSMHVIAIDLLSKNIDIARAMATLKPFVDPLRLWRRSGRRLSLPDERREDFGELMSDIYLHYIGKGKGTIQGVPAR